MSDKVKKPSKKPEKTGGWVYTIPVEEKSPEERSVIRSGYPWISISTISKNKPLGFHAHHSANTHLILTGEYTFHTRTDPDKPKLQTPPIDIGGFKVASNTIPVPADTMYNATVHKNGRDGYACFVEGHQVLSPTTRDRFLLRGDIKWEKGRDHDGPVGEDVRKEGGMTKQVLKGKVQGTGSGKGKKKNGDALVGKMGTLEIESGSEEEGEEEGRVAGRKTERTVKDKTKSSKKR